MNFDLSETQKMVQDEARRFATEEVAPGAGQRDRDHAFPAELIPKMAELGYMGVCVEEKYGGSELDTISYTIVIEEIARACATTAVVASVNNSLVCYPLSRFGTEDQKQKWLRPLAEGKLLGSYALSEPEAGSDAKNQRTTATTDGDFYVLDGTTDWIPHRPPSDPSILPPFPYSLRKAIIGSMRIALLAGK